MLRVVLAPNAFKESLTASQVAQSLAQGFLAVIPDCEIEEIPLADGGDGTLEAMVGVWAGRIESFKAHDPLGRPVLCPVGFDPSRSKAILEMARVSGLALLSELDKDPSRTTTFGLGEVLKALLERGVREIYLGIGGSATNEGGAGMGEALGFSHLPQNPFNQPPTGGTLERILRIERSPLWERIQGTRVKVLCDVDNPLLGPRGATQVFGPQKGANAAQLIALERGLAHLSSLWTRDLQCDVAATPGAGAAGGLGGGAIAYLGAELVPGANTLVALSNLAERLRSADLVITGEGRLDGQTLQGKLPGKVAGLALQSNVPCWGVGGSVVEAAREDLLAAGFKRLYQIAGDDIPVAERKTEASIFLLETGRAMAEDLLRSLDGQD